MSTPTHELIGELQSISSDMCRVDLRASSVINEAAIRLQELDNEVTQLRLQLEKFERKAKKTGTGGVG